MTKRIKEQPDFEEFYRLIFHRDRLFDVAWCFILGCLCLALVGVLIIVGREILR